MRVFSLLLAALSFSSPLTSLRILMKHLCRGALPSRANLSLHLLTLRRGFPSRLRAGGNRSQTAALPKGLLTRFLR